MNITTKDYSGSTSTESVASFVERAMDCSDYGSGQLEDIQGKSRKTAETLGRLCELLADRKLLSADDITHIACPVMAQREGALLSVTVKPTDTHNEPNTISTV